MKRTPGYEIFFKPFDYIPELDAFKINKEFDKVAEYLGIKEWHSAVWIGRFFTLDSDYGEHWFDNWDLREEKRDQAEKLGFDADDLLFIDPRRFKMKDFQGDGPVHSDEQIKLFWTNVLKSLTLNVDVLVEEARKNKSEIEKSENAGDPDLDYIPDLETRIGKIMQAADKP